MLCVIAKIDDEATKKLASIRSAAFPDDAAGFRPLHGHITIAAYTGKKEDRFIQSCRKRLENVSSFDVVYETIEVLEATSIIAAIPQKSAVLDMLHQSIVEASRGELDEWTRPSRWYPHTTLYFDPRSDLAGIRLQMAKSFVPFAARVSRIEFSRVLENGYDIVDFLALPPRAP